MHRHIVMAGGTTQGPAADLRSRDGGQARRLDVHPGGKEQEPDPGTQGGGQGSPLHSGRRT
jgi:hypothetical protein